MPSPNSRRDFLRTVFGGGLTLTGLGVLCPFGTGAIQPFQRQGTSRLLLSLAVYSFRDYFVDTNHKRDADTNPAKRIDLFQFVDLCAANGCHGAELTSYYFPRDVTSEFLLKLRRHAFLRGVEISGTAVGNTFTLPKGEKRDQEIALVKKWIDHASLMGAPHIRIFAGTVGNLSKADAIRLCVEAIEECCDYAAGKGIFLGLENHGGIVAEADDLLEIVRSVKSPWFGVNLDTGNFSTDDPYGDIAKCASYAVNVQLKVEIRQREKKKESSDLARLMKILRDANYQGYVALEYEASEDPWQAVPAWLKQIKALL